MCSSSLYGPKLGALFLYRAKVVRVQGSDCIVAAWKCRMLWAPASMIDSVREGGRAIQADRSAWGRIGGSWCVFMKMGVVAEIQCI